MADMKKREKGRKYVGHSDDDEEDVEEEDTGSNSDESVEVEKHKSKGRNRNSNHSVHFADSDYIPSGGKNKRGNFLTLI